MNIWGQTQTMEENRLNAVLKAVFVTSKWNLRIVHVMFFIWAILVLVLITGVENIRNFCIEGTPSALDKILVKDKQCQVDWMYFVRVPIFVMSIIYMVIMVPGFVFYYGLKNRFSVISVSKQDE